MTRFRRIQRYQAPFLFAVSLFISNATASSKDFKITREAGSFESQLRGIVQEINAVSGKAPITIRIEEGYYGISRTIELTGSRHPIIISGTKSKTSIISGSIEVDGWMVMPNGLWRSQVPNDLKNGYIPDQLFVNGERMTRARIPNDGFFVLADGFKEDAYHGAVLKSEDIEAVSKIAKTDNPILTIFRKWTVSKRFLYKTNPSKKALLFAGSDFPSYNPLASGNGIVIENTLNGIDTPGEWCVDKEGFIYYKPKEGERIESTKFRIPIVETLFKIKSSDGMDGGISFINVVFEHTTYQMPSGGLEFGQAASRMSAAIEVDDIINFTLKDCEVRNLANNGIWLRQHCTESSIIRSFFHDLGASAIKIGTVNQVEPDKLTKHIIVDNSIIHNYGVLMENAVGIILFNASDCLILHNDIHCGNYTGISLGWVWGYGNSPSKRNEVSYNRITRIGTQRLNDLAGIYTLGKSEGTYIHHNVISDVYSGDYRGWGIYADEGTTGITVEKNLVERTTSGGFHQHYGSENVVVNNIFAWGERSQFTLTNAKEDNPLSLEKNVFIMNKGSLFSGGGVNSDRFVVGNNCYWTVSNDLPLVNGKDVKTWIIERDSTSLFQDPVFRDTVSGDYRIGNKSVTTKIGFEEFDYSRAGVYGKRKWRKLAQSLR